jgi:hypothetical protein
MAIGNREAISRRRGEHAAGGLDAVVALVDDEGEAARARGAAAEQLAAEQALLDRNDEALTQMTYAASEGDVDAVRALAARGLNLDAGDYDNRTTLHLAAAEGNARVVALL